MLGQVATLHAAHARNRMARLGPLLQYLEQLRFGAADGALDQVSDLLVADLFADDSVPFQNAAQLVLICSARGLFCGGGTPVALTADFQFCGAGLAEALNCQSQNVISDFRLEHSTNDIPLRRPHVQQAFPVFA